MMFARIMLPTNRPMQATAVESGWSYYQMFRLQIEGEAAAYYSVIRETPTPPTVEIFSVLGGERDYVCAANAAGEHYCDCPYFEHVASREGRLCKHLHGVLSTGIMTAHCPDFLKPKVHTNGNETTDPAATPERHADEACPAA